VQTSILAAFGGPPVVNSVPGTKLRVMGKLAESIRLGRLALEYHYLTFSIT